MLLWPDNIEIVHIDKNSKKDVSMDFQLRSPTTKADTRSFSTKKRIQKPSVKRFRHVSQSKRKKVQQKLKFKSLAFLELS